mgnify:CR=1 FL=1
MSDADQHVRFCTAADGTQIAYAVSGQGGAFDIQSLPPGTYTIEAWHEKLGTQTQMVTIGPKETKELSFTFKL